MEDVCRLALWKSCLGHERWERHSFENEEQGDCSRVAEVATLQKENGMGSVAIVDELLEGPSTLCIDTSCLKEDQF